MMSLLLITGVKGNILGHTIPPPSLIAIASCEVMEGRNPRIMHPPPRPQKTKQKTKKRKKKKRKEKSGLDKVNYVFQWLYFI